MIYIQAGTCVCICIQNVHFFSINQCLIIQYTVLWVNLHIPSVTSSLCALGDRCLLAFTCPLTGVFFLFQPLPAPPGESQNEERVSIRVDNYNLWCGGVTELRIC